MGQYWYPVNLDKKEYILPHMLGSGLKLWEQLANYPGTGVALVILMAAQREMRGGGDLDLEENWHGPERTFPKYNILPGPMPEDYQKIASQIIGRWAGDRVALVGDYAKDTDLAPEFEASKIYDMCYEGDYINITEGVARVIEHELNGHFEGDGWKEFKRDKYG